MPRRPRLSTSGLFFHVLNRAAKRATLFENAADYDVFERILAAAVARDDVALFAYCVMPNHWHLLLSTRTDGGLSRFMHWLTTTHARRWQTVRGLDGQGAVYQGRFKAVPIGNDEHFLWVCRYVERNPLRAGLVGRAEDWPWSSVARLRVDPATAWLTAWPVNRPPDWMTHVNRPQTEAELKAFRRAIATGEPFGDDEWRRGVMTKLGVSHRRRWSRRKPQ